MNEFPKLDSGKLPNSRPLPPKSFSLAHVTFCQIMYGVLYVVSPEVFPGNHRGTGNGLTATATRVFGVLVCVPSFPAPKPVHANLPWFTLRRRRPSSRYTRTLILSYLSISPVCSSLAQGVLRYCSHSNRRAGHPSEWKPHPLCNLWRDDNWMEKWHEFAPHASVAAAALALYIPTQHRCCL